MSKNSDISPQTNPPTDDTLDPTVQDQQHLIGILLRTVGHFFGSF